MHDPYASKTEVNCSGAASDQDTAFRKAEKQYQLHLEQVVKNRWVMTACAVSNLTNYNRARHLLTY
jgi:hypothetical protein